MEEKNIYLLLELFVVVCITFVLIVGMSATLDDLYIIWTLLALLVTSSNLYWQVEE